MAWDGLGWLLNYHIAKIQFSFLTTKKYFWKIGIDININNDFNNYTDLERMFLGLKPLSKER